ncbi:MAG: hypothetical protein KDC48_22645, partial [Planctomycetes bacterium]|nr:hypothetical protein [Planctomycetota bacterium]
MSALAITVAALLLAAAPQQDPRPTLPGPQADGTTLLPNGWRLAPHGAQVPLPSDLPVRSALHPGGRWLAIQHAGYRKHQVTLFDTQTGAVAGTVPLTRTWSGLAWSPDGGTLYASGGVDDLVRVFGFDAA